MANPRTVRDYLLEEVAGLEPFASLVVIPSGRPLHALEVMRTEEGGLDLRVPARARNVPPLDEATRSALGERGFASEGPADPHATWQRSAEDAEAAVTGLLELLGSLFGEKPDAALDIAHADHRLEYEARRKLAVARTRIEKITAEVLGRTPESDSDGDFVLPIGEVHVTIAPRAARDGRVVVRVFAIANVAVNVTPDLGIFLARLNFGLMFGRFALDVENRAIWFDETLLGEQFREEELRFAIEMVASTADAWDDRLKGMFGGATYQEVLAGASREATPPTKPGEGIGQYL